MWKHAILFVSVFNYTTGELLQMMDSCRDILAYKCVIDEMNSFLNWEIQVDMVKIHLNTLTYTTPVGTNFSRYLGKSHVFGTLLFVNNSLFISSLTITEASTLNGIVHCNQMEKEIYINIPDFSSGPSIFFTLGRENISVSWNLSSISLVELSLNKFGQNFSTEDNTISIGLLNIPFQLRIYFCNVSFDYNIGSCLLNQQTLHLLQNYYILHHDTIWELTCINGNITFNTTCNNNVKWDEIACKNDSTITIDADLSINTLTNESNLLSFTTLQYPIVASVIAAVILALLGISLVLLTIWRCKKNKKQRKSRMTPPENKESTYEHLSSNHLNNNNERKKYCVSETSKIPRESDYSTLLHKNCTLKRSEEYATIPNTASHNRRKGEELAYAEIHTYNQCGQVTPFDNHTVPFVHICTSIEEQDEEPPSIPLYNPCLSEETTTLNNQTGSLPMYEQIPANN